MKKTNYLCLLMAVLLSMIVSAQIQQIEIDFVQLSGELSEAPLAESIQPQNSAIISFPYTSNSKLTCYVIENRIMSDRLRGQYPDISTYAFRAVENAEIFGRATLSPSGFYCTFFTDGTLITISPADRSNPSLYQIEIGVQDDEGFTCRTSDAESGNQLPPYSPETLGNNPLSLTNEDGLITERTYDLVIGATGEFTVANGGTISSANEVLVQTVNVLDALFQKEISIGFNLVDVCIEINPASDPFIPDNMNSASGLGIGESRTTQANNAIMECTQVAYNIGHVFHNHDSLDETDVNDDGWTGGGVVGGAICSGNSAAGWSGSFNNITNEWYFTTAHEFGHQLGAAHTWNGNGDACVTGNGQYIMNSSVEIGAGITIMAYPSRCDDAWNYGSRENYFNGWSLAQMTSFINNTTCETILNTNNHPPNANANPCNLNTISIPKGTPFKLTGSGSDEDNDELTYNWEQVDNGGGDGTTKGATLNNQGADGLTAGNSNDAPIFRSYPPTTNPTRYFPNFTDHIENGNLSGTEFEVLPQVERDINFVLTVRDCNSDIGGVSQDLLTVSVENTGPLVLNDLCTTGPLMAGNNYNLTWNTNGSDNLCTNVDILMSVDGGITFPYNLAEDVSYSDQAINISLPSGVLATNNAKFMVVCADSDCTTFFAVNENNCEIISGCKALNSVICSDEPIEVPINSSLLNFQLNNIYTEVISSITLTNDEFSTITINNSTDDDCFEGATYFSDSFNFFVTESGIYNFTFSTEIGYNFGSIFTETLGCGNFIASSGSDAGGGYVSTNSSRTFSADLVSCQLYNLTAWSFSNDTGIVPLENIGGTGNVLLQVEVDETGLAYTFIAINQTNDQIELVNSNSNFTNLNPNCYYIYGLSYAENEDPDTFVGSTINEILLSGSCIAFSENFKPVCVLEDTDCPSANTINNQQQTICSNTNNPLNDYSNWKTQISSANPLNNQQDPNSFGLIQFSSIEADVNNSPNGLEPDGSHTGVDVCSEELYSTYAYLTCTMGTADESDDTHQLISIFDLTIYPLPGFTNLTDGMCGGAISSSCANVSILYSIDNFATSTTEPYSLNPGDDDLAVQWMLSLQNAPADCFIEGNYTLSCIGIMGCTDATACNFDVMATVDNGSCLYDDCEGNCGGAAIAGTTCDDGDPNTTDDIYTESCVCMGNQIPGCTDATACNFDVTATVDNGSCLYNDCEGNCGGDATAGTTCDDGDPNTTDDIYTESCVCMGNQIPGCTDMDACNFDVTATVDNGSCLYDDCEGNCGGDATAGTTCDDGDPATENDIYLANCNCMGEPIEIGGCTNSSACNFNSNATVDDNSCTFPGTNCNDNNNCTVNDRLQEDCTCVGTLIDNNQNNICDLNEDISVVTVPTMSEWGLFILSLLLLNLVYVRILVSQQQLSNLTNQTTNYFNWFSIKSYPFDATLYLKAVKTSLILLPAIVLLIFLIYQELVWADFIGLSITIPVLSYLLHLFMLNNKD